MSGRPASTVPALGRERACRGVACAHDSGRQEPHPAGSAMMQSMPAGRRILVVDDNHDAADLLAEYLEALGHTTRVAYDGGAALAVADEFQPDLVMLDIGLPVMDGYEVARNLRQRRSSPELRLVALTGYGQESDRQRALEAGFDAHLVKPLSVHRLVELLRGMWD